MDTLLAELRKTKFPKQKRSQTVSPVPVSGLALGLVRDFVRKRIVVSRYTEKYERLWSLCRTLADTYLGGFEYTSIQINKDFACDKHRDKNNIGLSAIVALGDFEGGRLVVEGESVDIRESFFLFEGAKKEHWVEAFEGERYSIVYFTIKPYRSGV